MQRRAPDRMVGRVDARVGGDVDELADAGGPGLRILHHVGIVAERRLQHDASLRDLGIAPERAADDFGGRMHERRLAQSGRSERERPARRLMRPRARRTPTTSITRSARRARTSSSWKIARNPAPLARRSAINSTTASRFSASSEAVGSSRMSSAWSPAKPRAILTRCCSPPEKVAGGSRHSRSGRLRRVSREAARAARRLGLETGLSRRGGDDVDRGDARNDAQELADVAHDAPPRVDHLARARARRCRESGRRRRAEFARRRRDSCRRRS